MVWYQYVASAVAVIATALLVPGIIKDERKKKTHTKKGLLNLENADDILIYAMPIKDLKTWLISSIPSFTRVEVNQFSNLNEVDEKKKLIEMYENKRREIFGGKTRRRNTRNRNTKRNKSKKLTKRNKSKKRSRKR
jgi:hypothetical protein